MRSRRAGASAVGSTVPSQGAKTAIRTSTSRIALPITMVGWRTTKVIARPRRRTGGSTSGSGGAATMSGGKVVVLIPTRSMTGSWIFHLGARYAHGRDE